MSRRIVLLLGLLAVAPEAIGQEQGWNEVRQRLSRVPAEVFRLAEKEAPGVRFTTVFKDQEKAYRLVGGMADGRTISIYIDRHTKLQFVEKLGDVKLTRLPRIVAGALQAELRKKPELAGFSAARISSVDRFNAINGSNASYFELLGRNAEGLHYLIQIDPGGQILRDSTAVVHPDYFVRKQPIAPAALPAAIQAGAIAIAPGVRFTRAYLQTNTKPELGVPPEYVLIGRDRGGNSIELRLYERGSPNCIKEAVPLGDVPKIFLDVAERRTKEGDDLKGFRPTAARRMRLLTMDEEIIYLLYGDDAEGDPVELQVHADGKSSVTEDPREDSGPPSSGIAAGKGVPAQGFAVLAAHFGRETRWVDVVDHLQPAISDGRLDYQPHDLPDPVFGSHKGLAIVYSNDGKVGLSTTFDDHKVALPPPVDDASTRMAEVPARGFAVLAARYGSEGQWADVTEAVRGRVVGGRLEVLVPDLKLADPFAGALKSVAIAYSVDGNVGLAVIPEHRPISLPPEGPPINSSALEIRRVDYMHGVSSVAFLPDGKQVVAGVEDGSVRVIEIATGRQIHRFEGHGPGTVAVAVSPSGNLAISGGADSNVRLWDLKTGREKSILRGHTAPITNIAFAANGRLAASSSWDKTARVWEIPSGKQSQAVTGHAAVIMGVGFSPDGRQLATTSWDQSCRLWEVATGRELAKTTGEYGSIGDLAVSKDGRRLFFGVDGFKIKSWAPATSKEPDEFVTSMASAWAIDPFPDGRKILFTDENAAVVWDLTTSRTVIRLDRHTAQVVGLAVSPDGRRAATASQDRTLRIWNVAEGGP